MPDKGLFITFEGSEGVGKTTQIKSVADYFRAKGRETVISREPGGTALGEEIRHLLKHSESGRQMIPRAELLLFAASRAQHVDELIVPALREGKVVICDRFLDSTTVYQGIARAIDSSWVNSINQFAIDGCVPDITIVIDLDPEVGFSRIQKRNTHQPDRMEEEAMTFYEAVRQGYLDLAKTSDRFLIVDGSKPPETVTETILHGIKRRIE